jgi:myo-inositol 2-dehydrogenase/D-chiro-inositol 1-dehydrogenase
VNLYYSGGIIREAPATYLGRFEMAFVRESNEFAVACLDGALLPIKLSNAVKVVEVGTALREALVSERQIHFDEIGRRREKARL